MRINNKIKKKLKQKVVYLIIIIVLILAILLFNIDLIQIITIMILIIASSFSKIYKRFTSISLGFELVTPTIFWFAYELNLLFTIFAAFIMLLISAFISSKIKFPALVVQLGVYAIIGTLIALFSSVSFIPLAITMIFVRIIIYTIAEVVLLGSNFVTLGVYVAGNTFFNILIILIFSNYILELI